MKIATVGQAFPQYRYEQQRIREELEDLWGARRSVTNRLAALHENVRVEHRNLVLPVEEYRTLRGFGEANDIWIRAALDLGEEAVRQALDEAGLEPRDVDAIFTVSVTGVASPSLDARLVNRMRLRSDIKRTPIFGLGCVAGVAGISRAIDYARAYPDQVVVLLAVELCSLTFQRDDASPANMISTALFGDGAAAVVIAGERRARESGLPGLRVIDTRSVFYPDTEELMGWRISERGFDIVLSPEVPEVARQRLASDVDAFLESHGLARGDLSSWVCHPGGPKVLSAIQEGLGLSEEDVRLSWDTLREHGNLSSVSALLVLRETLARAGTGKGLCLAMGPAFCSELVLFEWC